MQGEGGGCGTRLKGLIMAVKAYLGMGQHIYTYVCVGLCKRVMVCGPRSGTHELALHAVVKEYIQHHCFAHVHMRTMGRSCLSVGPPGEAKHKPQSERPASRLVAQTHCTPAAKPTCTNAPHTQTHTKQRLFWVTTLAPLPCARRMAPPLSSVLSPPSALIKQGQAGPPYPTR